MASIGVFCGSATEVDADFLDLAGEVGETLAKRGHTVVSGGGKVGMMGALTGAARAAGGRTVGVIPDVLYGLEVGDTDSDELIVTGGMGERKSLMVAKSDAFLALPGGIGTMDELFEVWTTAVLGLHRKPLALLSPDHFYEGLLSYVDMLTRRRFLSPEAEDRLRVVHTVPDAVEYLESALA